MLTMRTAQIQAMTRLGFYERLNRFVAENGRRDDWTAWMADRPRVQALWDAVWPQACAHSEHDCALFLILLAIRAFEGTPVDDPADLLGQVAAREVAFKNYIADRGYLYFTAFDYPHGESDEGLDDV